MRHYPFQPYDVVVVRRRGEPVGDRGHVVVGNYRPGTFHGRIAVLFQGERVVNYEPAPAGKWRKPGTKEHVEIVRVDEVAR